MSDKKLLEESTIRRFMKLANINENESSLLSEVKSPVTGGSGQVSKGNKKFSAGEGKHKVKVKKHSVKEGYDEGMENESELAEAEDDMGGEAPDMGGMDDMGADDMGGDEMGGDDLGGEGGDTKTKVEDAVESLKNALNDILDAVGSDKQVEDEGGEGEDDGMGELPVGDEGGEGDEADAEAGDEPMMEKKDKKKFPFKKKDEKGKKDDEDEELEESIELVDEDLLENLLKRVTARLVAEAKAQRKGLKENSGGGSTSHSPKGNTYKPHKPGTKASNGYTGSGKTLGSKGKHQAKVKKH